MAKNNPPIWKSHVLAAGIVSLLDKLSAHRLGDSYDFATKSYHFFDKLTTFLSGESHDWLFIVCSVHDVQDVPVEQYSKVLLLTGLRISSPRVSAHTPHDQGVKCANQKGLGLAKAWLSLARAWPRL